MACGPCGDDAISLKRAAISRTASAQRDALELALALLADAPQRVEQTLGVVDAIEIVGDFLAEEAAREGMVAVAAKFDRAAARSSTVTTMPQVSGQSCGIAGEHRQQAIADVVRLPGRLTMSELPRMPAICRDRIAVGTKLSDTARISSPKPSRILSQIDSVASGVTSRFAGPVPPVVTTRQHFS